MKVSWKMLKQAELCAAVEELDDGGELCCASKAVADTEGGIPLCGYHAKKYDSFGIEYRDLD